MHLDIIFEHLFNSVDLSAEMIISFPSDRGRIFFSVYPNSRGRFYHVQAVEVLYIWDFKREERIFRVIWEILRKAPAYSNLSKRCDLCLMEKLMLISPAQSTVLNKRSEIISKCRHRNKFYLSNFVGGVT